jgi:hypothetical protein
MAPSTANFHGDDAECLVAASLACRACLSGEIEWRLEVTEHDPRVHCRCRRCGGTQVVFVTESQALRLSLHAGSHLDTTPRPKPDALLAETGPLRLA